ncbi:hypothetical protein [Roseimaritima ulvae]|uniref:Uncharacterized protein n=1 Tax=Roseimaritima ulvae TaxID=980254 RepID=A0A5B9QNF3_9BACT|nr:hypothetical protein [Roseimaritima ulvae]QEG39180.1 hypothetical protein UC8_11410 [Roseimaritima ulvae]
MATSEQKRQKKLAKKRSKEIAKRKQLAAEKNALRSIGGQVTAASSGKFHQCYIYNSLLDAESHGIGAVVVSRFLPDGNVVSACFLIDRFCLGVKDCYARMMSPRQFSEHVQGMREHDLVRPCSPEMAKKCVADAVQWAGQFGITPHPDYRTVEKIWPDVDASQSDQEFSFGQDGKPMFIAGPNDSPARIQQVMDALAAHAGEDSYHITAGIDPDAEGFGEIEVIDAPTGEARPLDEDESITRIDPAE